MAIDYSDTMYKKVDGKPCPFCGCEEIRSYAYLHSGGWTTNIECSRCPAQMPSDNVVAALERWNARAYDPSLNRAIAHMKQLEWENQQLVKQVEDFEKMNLRIFLAGAYNVHEARHGNEVIYVGHDVANRWSAFFKGKEQDLGVIDTLDEVEVVAHNVSDSGKKCSIKLDWRLIPETEIKDLTE